MLFRSLGANSVSPLQIAACYSAIANDGNFGECRFVKQIIDNEGKIIYSRKTTFDKVIDSDINYLMLDNLKGSAKYGTGSKLKDFPFDRRWMPSWDRESVEKCHVTCLLQKEACTPVQDKQFFRDLTYLSSVHRI